LAVFVALAAEKQSLLRFFYPLVTTDLTRRQLTNGENESEMIDPMNAFIMCALFPPADFKVAIGS
jgi:hypothetical protein